MEIKDLFSHKIHSSNDDWAEKLIDIATIFAEFDGHLYDRSAIENRLLQISPRATKLSRDPSKFRDEISAYPAYLGLYRVEIQNNKWHIFLSDVAKQYLVCEEPNVPAFMLLQLILFQYPNGMGAAYYKNSNKLRIQRNTGARTLSFIENEIHLSPLRLICKGLKADCEIRGVNPLEAKLSLDEIFVLANDTRTNKESSPNIHSVVQVLREFRDGLIERITGYQSRFHILKHTDFFTSDEGEIKIRKAIGQIDAIQLINRFELINSINIQFNKFDWAVTVDDLSSEVRACSWGRYFDAVKTLEASFIALLTDENPKIYSDIDEDTIDISENIEIVKSENIYHLRQFNDVQEPNKSKQNKRSVYTDPELTHIRRQKANLAHKILLEKLYYFLNSRGAETYENEHIDLFAKIPTEQKYVFEVKSINENNLLSQSRKGISQLYEYRYRYQNVIGYDVNLFLVFPYEPLTIPWLQEYLCLDRNIGIIWFNENEEIKYSQYCAKIVKPLIEMTVI